MIRQVMIPLLALILCFGAASAEEAGILGRPFPDLTAPDGETFSLPGARQDRDTAPGGKAAAAFPVSPARDVTVENEGARELYFTNAAPANRLRAWIVGGDTARLRLELPLEDDPDDMVLLYRNDSALHEMPLLLNAAGDGYAADVPMPASGGGDAFASVRLMSRDGDIDADAVDVYLISGEAGLDALCDALARDGWVLTDAPAGVPAAPDAKRAYVLHMVDQYGEPVPGVFANFCTDTTCTVTQSDENGVIVFEGEPYPYHVQLIRAPEGYSLDADFELYTTGKYGEYKVIVAAEE